MSEGSELGYRVGSGVSEGKKWGFREEGVGVNRGGSRVTDGREWGYRGDVVRCQRGVSWVTE